MSTRRDGHVAVVRLERPDALNAISGEVADQLRLACTALSRDDDVWAVVLSAAGERAFSVGADLKERASFDLDDYYENRRQIRDLFAAVRALPQPTIAAVFGFALGGGFELALSCDLVVAAEGAEMGLPEARVGLLPGGGGTQLLARIGGLRRAKDMIFRGKRIGAEEARSIGVVTEVAPAGKAEDRAVEIARDICRSSPVAVRQAKRSIDAALGVPLAAGIDVENELWKIVIASDDRVEGIAAFNEKRDPKWSNR